MAKRHKRSKAVRVKYYVDRLTANRDYLRQTTPDYGRGANEIARSFKQQKPADQA